MKTRTHIPEGFKFFGTHVGIKRKRKDFGVIVADTPATSAALFTRNTFCGVSIPIGKQHVADHALQAVVVTSGVANVATGEEGHQNAMKICQKLSDMTGIKVEDILPSSTGVIGKQLPIDTVLSGMDQIDGNLASDHFFDFAQAIQTTDTVMKIRSIKIGDATILGVAKGSGMIEPNMATMLVYIVSDAKVDKDAIYPMLKRAGDVSFNMMSIDTDTSTSDTVVLMTSGKYEVDEKAFEDAFTKLCIGLAKDVAFDAEGATKLIECTVDGANSTTQARNVVKAVINSPLVKTAVYGADPNWGRVVMAIGKTFDTTIIPENITIQFGPYVVYERGNVHESRLDEVSHYLKEEKVCHIDIDLGIGSDSATGWGCDLTEEYIKINALYTT